MSLFLQTTSVANLYLGNTSVSRVYAGDTLVWQQNAGDTTVTQTNEGTIEINTTATDVTIVVSDTSRYDGTYVVAVADLSDPVQLVAPQVSGTAEVGQTLTADPGLWVYNTVDGAPTITHQWQRDGVDIAGATGTSYSLVAADQGTSVTCVETAADGNGSRSATSNAIAVPAAPATTSYTDNFDSYADGAILTDQPQYVSISNSRAKATVSGGILAVRAVSGATETLRRVEDVGADQFVEVLVNNTPDNSNRLVLHVRRVDADNSYFLFSSDEVTRIRKVVNGTVTTFTNDAFGAVQAGDRLRLSINGTDLTATRTRGGVDTVATYSDADLSAGQPAINFQNYGPIGAVAEVDELTVGEV